MDPALQAISQFLQAFPAEVGGNCTVLEKDLQSFAAGELEDAQLNDLSRDLLSNEKAMEKLASLLKGG